jgi:hypothetical protein
MGQPLGQTGSPRRLKPGDMRAQALVVTTLGGRQQASVVCRSSARRRPIHFHIPRAPYDCFLLDGVSLSRVRGRRLLDHRR